MIDELKSCVARLISDWVGYFLSSVVLAVSTASITLFNEFFVKTSVWVRIDSASPNLESI